MTLKAPSCKSNESLFSCFRNFLNYTCCHVISLRPPEEPGTEEELFPNPLKTQLWPCWVWSERASTIFHKE
jgi:hypothetical protein